MNQDALDVSLHALRAEAAHLGIDVCTLGHYHLIDFDVIEKTEAYPAAIHGLDVLVNDGLDEIRLLVSIGNGVEVVGCHLDLLHNFLRLVIITQALHDTLIDGELSIGFRLLVVYCVIACLSVTDCGGLRRLLTLQSGLG